MKQFVKDNFDFHAWLGALSAALLFIVAFSGSVALFHSELATWENPERRLAFKEDPHGVDAHWRAVKEKADFNYDTFFIRLPSKAEPYYTFSHFDRESQERITALTHPTSMEIVEPGKSDIAHLLAHLHTDLHLPRPYGRYLVGLTGVVMMLLIATGIFTHRKIFKEFFVWKRGGSLRSFFSSSHKLLGVWVLPFHLLMAFTGAIIGLLGIIGVFMALASYGGSVEKAAAAFLGPRAEPTGEKAATLPIADFVSMTEKKWDGFTATFIQIEAAGDSGAHIAVSGDVAGRLAMSTGATYNFANGELVHVQDWHGKGLPTLLFGMVVPLHYALYGGITVKFLYFFLGIGMALMILSGTSIWLERIERTRRRAEMGGVSYLTRFHVGVNGGLVAATATLFFVNHLGTPGNQGLIEAVGFWGVWILAIGYALLRDQVSATIRELVTVAGLASIGAAVVNTVVTGDSVWHAPTKGLYGVMAVDISLMFCGTTMLVAVWYQKLKRPAVSQVMLPTGAETT